MTTEEFRQRVFSLSERIYPMVVRILGNHTDAKDAIQEVMIKLWHRRARLEDHPNLSGYVFLTMRNHCLDILRSRKPPTIRLHQVSHVNQPDTGHEVLALNELIQVVEQILQVLPQQQREVLVMRDIDGLSYDEISAITKLKVPHLRVLLSRTRKYVQGQLKKNYSYE